VRQENVIVLSGSDAFLSRTRFSMAGECSYTVDDFRLFDRNNNPMPEGSKIEAIVEGTEFTSATVTPNIVRDTAAPGGTYHSLTLKRKETSGCDTAPDRTLPLEITTPRGNVTPITLTITK